MVQDEIAATQGVWERLAQLLQGPFSSRAPSNVEVQDLAPSMVNDEQEIQKLEGIVGTVRKSSATITSR
jgi:hypothetical protein